MKHNANQRQREETSRPLQDSFTIAEIHTTPTKRRDIRRSKVPPETRHVTPRRHDARSPGAVFDPLCRLLLRSRLPTDIPAGQTRAIARSPVRVVFRRKKKSVKNSREKNAANSTESSIFIRDDHGKARRNPARAERYRCSIKDLSSDFS